MSAANPGHRLELLENGEEFFPRVLAHIEAARSEVLIETFILFEDSVGTALHAACVAAAKRGVKVALTVDGYGSEPLSALFREALNGAGVSFRMFDARPRLLSLRTNLLRRLHRKIVVVDGRIALVGGINFSEEHLRSYGPESKQDYAVEVEGPAVSQLRNLVLGRSRLSTQAARGLAPARVQVVRRDNARHRNDIERMYRVGIRLAKRDILIANAYFFPGYRLLRDLRNAALRGVKVRLILQGKPDRPTMRWAAVGLYGYLQQAGVKIFEHYERPLHAKVAVIDDRWATVGSSNLDPVSLFLNLEANLLIDDPDFAAVLRTRLERLLGDCCTSIAAFEPGDTGLFRRLFGFATFHLARRLPRLFGLLPDPATERSDGVRALN